MSNCINKFFIANDKVKESSEFQDENITTGRSLYEVIRIIDGKPLFLKRHLDRMENSAGKADLKLWLPRHEVKNSILKLININKVFQGNMKIVFNYGNKNNFYAFFIKHYYPVKEEYEEGVDTILFFGERENPNAKIINMNFRKPIDLRIKEKKVFEAILVDRNGNITEGSRSNIFFVKKNTLVTAPVVQVLPGTTRQVVINSCRNMGLNLVEDYINYKDVWNFDGVFITGTSPKVLPVRSIDKLHFQSSRNHVVIEIMRAYGREIERDIKSFCP